MTTLNRGFMGVLSEKQGSMYPNTSQLLFRTRCTISRFDTGVRQWHIFMEQAGLPWRNLRFSGWSRVTIRSQNSTKTLNAHSLSILQQRFRTDARTFSCQRGLTSEDDLDGVRKRDCLPFHMPVSAASGAYSWLAVDMHIISGWWWIQ